MERRQQIESLFHDALRRDPTERDAWLREACHGDSGSQREVASLLANHEEGSAFEPWAAAAAGMVAVLRRQRACFDAEFLESVRKWERHIYIRECVDVVAAIQQIVGAVRLSAGY